MAISPSEGPLGFMGPNPLSRDRYTSPFYGISHKYMPQNIDHMLWWANHFLVKFGFYRAVLSRIANYFITSLNIECDDSDAKKKYEEIFEELQWKQATGQVGINLLAYSNAFVSFNQGFNRFLECPQCHKISNIDKIDDFEFSKKGQFLYSCPQCKFKGAHNVHDKPSKDIKRVNVTIWNPREINLLYEDTTGESEYFWRIPEDYKAKVMKERSASDLKFFCKKTPKVIYDSIIQDKMLEFNPKNFLHLKLPTPAGIKTDGKAIPLCIYLFDNFFLLKTLERHTEAICLEDIVPFRVISLAGDNSPQSNPILSTGGGATWSAAVEQMIQEHRRDPGAYHKFPFPINYQQLSGEGTKLAPIELMQQAIGNILNAYNIPTELYQMTLQTQAVGPALRLFENSWSSLIDAYNTFLNQWGDIIGKIKGLPKAKIGLVKVTLSDDMERKSIMGQLVAANSIARSELLGIYGFDYKEQLRKKFEEERITKDLQEEEANKEQLRLMSQYGMDGAAPVTNPNDVLEQAQQIAEQIYPLDGAGRREELQKIKAQDQTLWSAVKGKLEEMGSSAKSQGLQQSKQQAPQG